MQSTRGLTSLLVGLFPCNWLYGLIRAVVINEPCREEFRVIKSREERWKSEEEEEEEEREGRDCVSFCPGESLARFSTGDSNSSLTWTLLETRGHSMLRGFFQFVLLLCHGSRVFGRSPKSLVQS